jgi:shikimate 5-dehydrogenase
VTISNTDVGAIKGLLENAGLIRGSEATVAVVGTGGVAKAALAAIDSRALIFSRKLGNAEELAEQFARVDAHGQPTGPFANVSEALKQRTADFYINCTPVGMAGGPDPDGLSIPIPDMPPLPPETVFFDTVYNPIETPMLKAAKERGYRTIDGVQMFVRQAAAQFELWTGQAAPVELFDRLVRERLGGGGE